jgi:dihydrofolate reductase
MKLKLIVAMCKDNGIGYSNNIPWKIKKDLAYFYNKTCGHYRKQVKNISSTGSSSSSLSALHISNKKNAVVMGKNTWLSLPKYPEPLKNRDNIVLSRSISEDICVNDIFIDSDLIIYLSSISRMIDYCLSLNEDANTEVADYRHSIKHETIQIREINEKSFIENNKSKPNEYDEYDEYDKYDKYHEIWIIGGAQIYELFVNENVKNNIIDEICITYIDKWYKCDTFFPVIENMNQYYISSFVKSTVVDENSDTSLLVDVYYIVFTRIDSTNINNLKKQYIDVRDHTIRDNVYKAIYYYFTKNEDVSEYITEQNYDKFMWCITSVRNMGI